MSLKFYDKLTTFPPLVCRLLARHQLENGKVRAKTDAEVAAAAGMSESQIRSLSWLTSWDAVTVDELRRYSLACGVDFTSRDSMRAHRSYIKNNPKFRYLRRHPDWNTVFRPLVAAYIGTLS